MKRKRNASNWSIWKRFFWHTSIWAFVSSKASLCCFYLSLSLSIFKVFCISLMHKLATCIKHNAPIGWSVITNGAMLQSSTFLIVRVSTLHVLCFLEERILVKGNQHCICRVQEGIPPSNVLYAVSFYFLHKTLFSGLEFVTFSENEIIFW